MLKQNDKLDIQIGQTLLLEGGEYEENHIKKKLYHNWKVKEIYTHIVLCERKVKLGTIKESFTWQQLCEKLIRIG